MQCILFRIFSIGAVDPDQSQKIKLYVVKAANLLRKGKVDAKDAVVRFHQIARQIGERWTWILETLIAENLTQFASEIFATISSDKTFSDVFPEVDLSKSAAIVKPTCNLKADVFHSLMDRAKIIVLGE